MSYMQKINDLMTKFCESVPAKGTEPEYLEVATELEKLNTKTAAITNSNLSEEEIEERLEKVYNEMKSLIEI